MLDIRKAITSKDLDDEDVIKVHCPAHDDSTASLAVYADHIHCYGCGLHKTGEEAIQTIMGPCADVTACIVSDREQNSGSAGSEESYINTGFADLYNRFLCAVLPERRVWLRDRGLDDSTIDFFNLGHNGSSFVIPVYDEGCNLETLRFRADPSMCSEDYLKKHKYMGLKGRNGCYPYPAWLPIASVAVIVEGEFDAMRLWSLTIPAYTTTNGAGQVHRIFDLLPPLQEVKHVIIATDQDEPGDEAARALAQEAAKYGITHERWSWLGDAKDVTEYCMVPENAADLRRRYQDAAKRC